jgi:hypothetical protein
MKKCLSSIGCAWLFLAAGVAAQAQSQMFSNAVMALNPAAYWPLQETAQPPSAPAAINNYGTLGAAANANVGVDVMALPGPLGGAGDMANAFTGIGFSLENGNVGVKSADYETWQTAASPQPPFTFECWANAYNLTADISGEPYSIVASDMSGTRSGWLIYLSVVNTGQYTFRTYNQGTGTKVGLNVASSSSTAANVTANQWYHLVIVFDNTSGPTNVYAYLNGAQVASQLNVPGSYFIPNDGASGQGLTVGMRSDLNYNYMFHGAVAEVAYYTNALSSTTVAAHYAAVTNAATYASLVESQNPIIYLQMNEQPLAPVATNYGTLGAAANGYYEGGTAPGNSGPSAGGFPANSSSCTFGQDGQIATECGPGVQVSTANPRLLNVSNSFSLVACAQVSGTQSTNQVLWGQGESSYFLEVDTAGYPHFGDGSSDNLTGSLKVTDGNWHLWVATYNATNGSAVLYIDGVVAASNVFASIPTGLARYPFIGGSSQRDEESFVGSMAHVALYTNALSSSQVASLMVGYNGPIKPPPVVVNPIFPASSAEGWSNSTYVFSPLISDESGATVAYSWTLNSVRIAGATNSSLAFSSIPGLAVNQTYTLTVTGTSANGSISSSVQLQIDAPPAVAATLYADSFSRSGALNGSRPDVANVCNASWLADGNFKCNGSAVVDTSADGEVASLPFIPQSGHVYVLSSILDPLNSDDNWLGLGYGVGSAVNSYTGVNDGNFEPWLLARGNRVSPNSGAEFFGGPGTLQEQASSPFDLSGPSTYQIVLDTTQSSWTASFYEDGILQYGPVTFFSNPGIVSVFAANGSTGNGAFANFKLTDSVLPAAAPAIVQDLPATLFALPSFPATLTVAASGAAPLSYQWQFNGANLSDTTRIKGSGSNTLAILAAQAGDAGSYQVIVTNIDGSASSAVCVLSVGAMPMNINGVNSGGWLANSIGNSPNTPIIGSNLLTLTDGNGSECESVFFATPQYIGAFTASFTYQAVYAGSGGCGIGDGACFVLQNDPRGTLACGAPGGTLGFAGYSPVVANISPSVALCLNTYSPIGYSWNDNGNPNSPAQIAPGNVSLTAGDPINITVSYAAGTVALTMVDTVAQTSFSTNLHVGDITSVLGANTAYVGFGGSEGCATSLQTITNFTFTSIPLSISMTPTNWGLLTWPQTYAGYLLQQSSDLSSPSNWVNVTSTATLTNGLYQLAVPTTGTAFYRLNVLQ